jgi:hypothetical protein
MGLPDQKSSISKSTVINLPARKRRDGLPSNITHRKRSTYKSPQQYRKQKCSPNTTHNTNSIGLALIHFKERYKKYVSYASPNKTLGPLLASSRMTSATLAFHFGSSSIFRLSQRVFRLRLVSPHSYTTRSTSFIMQPLQQLFRL